MRAILQLRVKHTPCPTLTKKTLDDSLTESPRTSTSYKCSTCVVNEFALAKQKEKIQRLETELSSLRAKLLKFESDTSKPVTVEDLKSKLSTVKSLMSPVTDNVKVSDPDAGEWKIKTKKSFKAKEFFGAGKHSSNSMNGSNQLPSSSNTNSTLDKEHDKQLKSTSGSSNVPKKLYSKVSTSSTPARLPSSSNEVKCLTKEERWKIYSSFRPRYKKLFINWNREAISIVKAKFKRLGITSHIALFSFIGSSWLELWVRPEDLQDLQNL
jgi:hypothetical protein